MEGNADAFKELAKAINNVSSSPNNNVVLGFSMGGVVARYALADAYPNDNLGISKFISYNSPHRGAWVNPELITCLRDFPELQLDNRVKNIINSVASAAADQLLTWGSRHKEFYNELRGKAQNGYDPRITYVALTNGNYGNSGPSRITFASRELFTYDRWVLGTKWCMRHIPATQNDQYPGDSLPSPPVTVNLPIPFVFSAEVKLHFNPTFIPTHSALDFDETLVQNPDGSYRYKDTISPFKRVYINPFGSAPHDDFSIHAKVILQEAIDVIPTWKPGSISRAIDIEGLGHENAGGGVAVADFDRNGISDIVLMGVDNPPGENTLWYRIGLNLNADGLPERWLPVCVTSGLGHDTQGGGVAVGDINQNGIPDLIFMIIDNPPGANHFRYKIGYDVNATTGIANWGNGFEVPQAIGNENAGGDIAIGDINRDGNPDLLLMGVDNPPGNNNFWYIIGYSVQPDGRCLPWTGIKNIPGMSAETQGGGAVIGDFNKNGLPDILLTSIDHPTDFFRYIIGYDVDANGDTNPPNKWPVYPEVQATWDEAAGGGAALGDFNQDGISDIIFAAVNNPPGANSWIYRIVYGEKAEQAAPSLNHDLISQPRQREPVGDTHISKLYQNYPNPFNPETWIPYQLAGEAYVTIRIYNSNGQLVRILDLGYRNHGSYLDKAQAAYWDGTNERGERVASGVYFYRIQANDFTAVRKMVILK
jgi:hypothetical protein